MSLSLHRAITQGVWMMDEGIARNYLPFVVSILQGKNSMAAYKEQPPITSSYKVHAARRSHVAGSNSGASKEERLIAIHPIKGVITKADQECGPRGTETLMRDMKRMDNNDSVIAHVLDMDSGGGDGSNCKTVANFIRNKITKPVLVWFNGVLASAAYWIACAADEIYASEETDLISSIGVYLTLPDFKRYFKKKGIDLHEIYSTLSKKKNKDYKDALKGNYKPIQDKMLDPYARSFIESVKGMRAIADDGGVFEGETYMSEKAIEINLINGIKTFDEVIMRATELADNNNHSDNHLNMKTDRIQAVLSLDTLNADTEGYVSFSVEDVEKINAALPEAKEEPEKTPPKAEEKKKETPKEDDSVLAAIKGLSTKMDNLGKDVKANADKIQTIRATKPGEEETKPKTTKADTILGDDEFIDHHK